MNTDLSALIGALEQCKNVPILVVGDLMLDEYHWCTVDRISPEAPVPVCKVQKTTYAPGGAGNVASNVASLSGVPFLVAHVGTDGAGANLKRILADQNISLDCLVENESRSTILKSRIIAQKQHVVRLDREDPNKVTPDLQYELMQKLEAYLPQCRGIVLSDYSKGTLAMQAIQDIIELAQKNKVKVIVDPKGDDYERYRGAYLLTPNFKEFKDAVHGPIRNEEDIEKHGIALIQKLGIEALVITRSEKGMTILTQSGIKQDIPTKAREVSDITGAGDTVVAAMAMGVAGGLSLEQCVTFANYAAGVVVGKIGTSTVTMDEVIQAVNRDLSG